jgi:serine/threonine protein kinase
MPPSHNPSPFTGGIQLALHHVKRAHLLPYSGLAGDLKPENVLLKADSSRSSGARGMITDFGLCAALHDSHTHISNWRAGTPFYIAPEVAKQGRLTKASDAFSFGVLAWQVRVVVWSSRHGCDSEPQSIPSMTRSSARALAVDLPSAGPGSSGQSCCFSLSLLKWAEVDSNGSLLQA